ncbi:hypothetical protein B0H10DRAFT_1940740 [Mycena sp. CBHHK59/15]|nr:hypothetical protein B0H10DRAFT_1940740 [Mycena sp. CBHHK59/15]
MSGNPTQLQKIRHAPSASLAWHWIASLLIRSLTCLSRFCFCPRDTMAALAALLMRLPDTVLEQFRDAQAWLRQRGDMDHLLDIPASNSNFPFDPRSMYGTEGSVENSAFNGYPAVNFDEIRSATPSSCYSYHTYDDYQSSNYSGPSSEFDYLSASGVSTPYSGLDLFGDNFSEPNLDWDRSLAALFNSAETSALGSGANVSFLPPDNLSFAVLPSGFTNADPSFAPVLDPTAAAAGSDASFFPQNAAPSHLRAPDPATFLSPPQENFKFEDGNLRLMTQEEIDAAGEAWQWVRSDTVWLDKDVSSDVYIPTHPFSVTKNLKVGRIERVHGIPSQFPVPRLPTAYLVDFSSSRDTYKDDDGDMINLDKILKDKRLNQGSGIQDKAICYVNTVKGMKCTAKNASGGACGGYQVLKEAVKARAPKRPKILLCMQQPFEFVEEPFRNPDSSRCRREFMYPPFPGRIDRRCRIIGSGSGKKGKCECPFPHTKDGKSHVATMRKLSCEAGTTFLVPLDEENIPLVVVVPKPFRPHTHPPPPDTKVPTHVKLLYEQAIRAFGISIATVNKVEQAASTIQIMGAAPGLVHPSLLHAPTKQAIISALKRREPGGDKSGWEADQEKDPRERYMHSFDFLPGRSPPSAVITTFENILLECVHYVRSLDQDTTFKRMKAGLLNEYELTAFFTPLNRLFTFGRIYMDAKDADAFEFVWDKIDEAFYGTTGKHLAFKAWDPDGWLVTVSGDMEAAPWIGMARSFIKRMDSDKRPTVDEFLPKVLRICRRHALEGLRHSVKPHVDEDQWTRFEGILSLKTRDEANEFSNWVFSLDIKPITAWWNHKLNHKWILPGLLECLSGLSHEDWLTTPFTSNGNETQHHWTNSQTGIGLPARECILRAAKADHAVGEQFQASLASGIMANNRNELSHRTTRNAKRHTSTMEKAKRANAGNNKIKELKAELAILIAESKASLFFRIFHVSEQIADEFLGCSKDAAGRTKAPKKKTADERELDGIQMTSPEASLDAANDAMVISLDDADLGVPSVNPISPSAPSPASPHPAPPTSLSTRRSSRKRGASKTHDDAPAPKSKKTEAATALGASNSAKKCVKRKPKSWSVRHTDDKIYTSFEFLAQFPQEYRAFLNSVAVHCIHVPNGTLLFGSSSALARLNPSQIASQMSSLTRNAQIKPGSPPLCMADTFRFYCGPQTKVKSEGIETMARELSVSGLAGLASRTTLGVLGDATSSIASVQHEGLFWDVSDFMKASRHVAVSGFREPLCIQIVVDPRDSNGIASNTVQLRRPIVRSKNKMKWC